MMGTIDDGTLWRRIQLGDAVAFGELFERHAAKIHGYCFRRLGDWTLAEDLTSVTFLEAWRARTRAELQEPQVLPWLYGVATNALRNASRSRRRHAAALERIPPALPEPDFTDAVAERFEGARLVNDLRVRLASLPLGEREALVLVWWQGLTISQAAYSLGVPEGTVKSRLFRVRQRLRSDRLGTPSTLSCEESGS